MPKMGRIQTIYSNHMDLTTFARQLETEAGENYDALMEQFPDRLETENGYEPTLGWDEFILDRISKSFSGLDDDAREEMLEDVRSHICV